MSDGTTTPPPSPPAPPATPPPPAWTAALDAEVQGHLAMKGWDKLDPAAAAVEAAKAHRAAEQRLGIPANELLRRPKEGDEVATRAFWKELGAGEKPEDYAFENLTFGDEALDARFVAGFKSEAAAAGMPKAMADRALRWFQKNHGELTKTQGDIDAGKIAEEKAALATSWGANAEANTFIAKQGAKRVQEALTKLGINAGDVVAELEGKVGYRGVMEMFKFLGEGLGEAKFVAGGARQETLTPVTAQARLGELMSDPEWSKRYMAGGADEKKQFASLTALIASA
jgi:hypothetical protein